MEDSKTQHYLMLQQQQQQFLLLQQIQQQQQQQSISRFPSNIRPIINQQQNPNPMTLNSQINRPQTNPWGNQAELQMAYQDAWRVGHPDFKRPFASLEDAVERLLPYHVVADYEAEEDDRILDSDITGQVLSRTEQWDQSIANKVSEFTANFEKQLLTFNIISRKRAIGEFRSEERLSIEQALFQDDRRSLMEARTELERQQKVGREAHTANMRMMAMAQAEQARAQMMARTTRDEKEVSEDFLNDEERLRENGDMGVQSEFDLNTR